MEITKEVLQNEIAALTRQEADNRVTADRARTAADIALGAIQFATHLLALLDEPVITQDELEKALGGKVESIDRIGPPKT